MKNSNINYSAIGLDLGGTNLHLGIIEQAEVVDSFDIAFEHQDNVNDEIDAICEAISPYLKSKTNWPIGIASAGFFDYTNKKIVRGVNFDAVSHPQFFPMLAKKLGSKKVAYLNDADAAALGSSFSLQKTVFHFTLGTGVGTGAANPYHILHLTNGFGIDLGHAEFTNTKSLKACNCGSEYCVESFFGKHGLLLNANTFLENPIDEMKQAPEDILEHENFNNHLKILQKFIRFIQIGFGPDTISFSGGNSRFITPKVEDIICQTLLEHFPKPEIRVFKGDQKRVLGILGAGIYVINSMN